MNVILQALSARDAYHWGLLFILKIQPLMNENHISSKYMPVIFFRKKQVLVQKSFA